MLALSAACIQGIFSQTACIVVDSVTPVCQGSYATLHATLQPGCMNGTNSYSFETFAFNPQPLVTDTAIDPEFKNNLGLPTTNYDDAWAGPYPIGFNFCFLGTIFRAYWVGSNGWISFSDPKGKGWTIFTPFSIPNTASAIPKNAIFAPYQDWNPSGGGPVHPKLYRHIISDPPNNSKLVVYWDSCALYGCSSALGSFQIVLNQSDYSIENNITVKPSCTWQNNAATQGVHNEDGTIAFIAFNRNANSWTTSNESTRFVPNGITWYQDSYPGGAIAGYGPTLVVNPMSTTTYYAVIEDCSGSSQSGGVNVRVYPDPALNGPSKACLGSVSKYSTDPSKTNYIWTVVGGTVSGGGTGTSDTVLVGWNSVPGSHSVSIMYTDPVNGCSSLIPVSRNVSVENPPTPSVISGIASVCPGDTGNLYQSQPGKLDYIWSVSAGGTISSGGGSSDSWAKVTWDTPGTGTVSVQYSDPVTGCGSLVAGTYTVTVKPVPDVIFTPGNPSATWCSSDTVRINLSSSVNGASFIWSSTANPSFISPPAVSNMSGNIRQPYINSGTATETVNFQARATAGGCTSLPWPYPATINPVPGVNIAVPQQYICSGGLSQSIALSSPTAGSTFNWSYLCSGGLAPCPGSGSGTSIPPISLSNNNSSVNNAVVTVRAMLDGCPGTTAIHVISVNPLPKVSNTSMSQNVCLGQATTQVALGCNLAPASFRWIAGPSHPSISGYITGWQTSAVIPSQTLTDPLNLTGFVTYSVIPSVLMNSLTCYGDTAGYVINTRPSPVLNITGPLPSLACEGQSNSFSVVNEPGTVYTWTLVPSSAGNLTSPQGQPGSEFQWNTGGSGIGVNVSAVSSYGCSSSSGSTFTILPKPWISLDLCIDPVTTTDAKPYILRGGRPAVPSGEYSGQGVSLSGGNYIFDPSAVSGPYPEDVPVTFKYTGASGCTASVSKTIRVVSPPAFQCGNNSLPLQDVRTSPRKTYTTYQKGGHCWMTVNLDYGSSRTWSQPLTDNCIPEKYCSPADDSCSLYGAFYPWDEMMQYQVSTGGQGLCPPGWHVPSLAEWQALIDDPYNQGNGLAGGFLKDVPFVARTGGVLFMNSVWAFIPSDNLNATVFWTSTTSDSHKAFARGMNQPNTSTSLYSASRANAFQLRCVKD